MASLYNRATPSQRRILRVIEGVCKNVADAHPDYQISPRAAQSIAKRAAGTLTAQWPDVLALRSAMSVSGERARFEPAVAPVSDFRKGPVRGSRQVSSRAPLRALRKELQILVKPAKLSGQMERAETLIDVLKMIAKLGVPK